MSRLDRHVAVVRTKMTTDHFLRSLAWTVMAFAAVVWVMILIDRLLHWRLPHVSAWFFGGAGVAVLVAFIMSYVRRPTAEVAAVAIDERLGLKEKFSTALLVRNMKDPFAQAAVKDAEQTAQGVNLHSKFPLSFPRIAYGTIAVALVAALTAMFLDPLDVIAKATTPTKHVSDAKKIEEAQKALKDALAIVNTVPPALAQTDQVKIAKDALVKELNKGAAMDPAAANREAVKRLEEIQDIIKETVKNNQQYAEAKSQEKIFKSLQGQKIDEAGPVNDARKALAQGNFDQAVNELNKVVENFEKMDKKEQEKAAEQMQKMAQQLKQMGDNPAEAQKMEQQLQQMGMNQQQAKQAQQLMQQAAQGNKQAQQQLQQMAQQAMQQMNNGQGPNPQQQQQLQQMMQQMQGMANAQQQAQQLGQQAQQMQQAMQQAAKQGQQAQQGQQGQQQQGQQGQQGQQQNQQQMQQAMQGMQSAMQQMQAMQADARQMQAAQNAAAQGQQQAMNNLNGDGNNGKDGGNKGGGDGRWDANGQIQGGQGQQQQPFNGQGGFAGPNQGGQGAGDRNYKNAVPFGVKAEMDASESIEKGRVLASSLVKGQSLPGSAKEQIKEVVEAAKKDEADEIDQDRVSRQAQKVVREYFSSMQKDADNAAAPAPTPAPDPAAAPSK